MLFDLFEYILTKNNKYKKENIMKKIIALSTVLTPSIAFAHSNVNHTVADIFSAHFLTQPDHMAIIAVGFVAVGFAVKSLVKK